MGSDTNISVKASDVGVMNAATIRIKTIAWRRYLCIKSRLSNPNLPSSHDNTGNSNTTPSISESITKVSMYDDSDIIFSTLSDT